MAGLTIVYRAIETEATQIVAMLENRCLHPVILDDPEKTGPYRGKSYEVQIAVPETERDMAVRILEQWERQERLRLFPLFKRTNAVFFLLMAALALLAFVLIFDTEQKYLLALEILLLALVATGMIRQAWRKKPDGSSAEESDRQ